MPNTPAPSDFQLGDLLCFSVYAAGHAFNRVYKPLLDKLGLTYPQYLVMNALWERDDRTVGELGRDLSLESNTLTPLLKRLEGLGRISRQRDPQDERQVRVRLTSAGKGLRRKAQNVPSCIVEASGLSLDELRRLQRDITRLRGSLERYSTSHP
jgi:MarR family transcriptional regulator, organic hydroperoxide resistance regulator